MGNFFCPASFENEFTDKVKILEHKLNQQSQKINQQSKKINELVILIKGRESTWDLAAIRPLTPAPIPILTSG